MIARISFAIFLLGGMAVAQDRTFTIKNKCKYTVWPGVFTDPNGSKGLPDVPTGWEMKPGAERSFKVPHEWKSGRIWGRRECDFSKNPGPLSCKIGGCNGGLECDKNTGTGVPPVTLGEWTLNAGGGQDYYDVSLVDGFGIPMAIENTKGCPLADCPVEMSPMCPKELGGPKDSNGTYIGCRSACEAGIDGNRGNSKNCCSGEFATPDKCPKSTVQFYDFFKGHCPNSYVYAYDEASGSALFTCAADKRPDYTIVFCP